MGTVLSLFLLIAGIFAKRPYSAEISFVALFLIILTFLPGKGNIKMPGKAEAI
jgi:hypothetical protein